MDGRTTTSATLAQLLGDSKVGWDTLEERYHVLLRLVHRLLGVVPNCDRYLEIWPPAFRSYNIMVPNLLNLPVPVLGVGGPPPGVVGLAMYVASRTAECPYCSAHRCSFAMRRGASPETVAASLLDAPRSLSPRELAVIAVARSLSRVPCELTPAEKTALVDAYGQQHAEWIVLSVVMMGFLNKFMDGIGVELEQDMVDEVADTMGTGWSPGRAGADLDAHSPRRPAPPADGLRTRLGLVPLLPGAIRYDKRMQSGTPKKPGAMAARLTEALGHDFPVLFTLRSNRARRAIVSMLLQNLDQRTSVIGIGTKLRAGAIFAGVVGDRSLAGDIRTLARRAGVDLDAPPGIDDAPGTGAVLALARAVSPSPAAVDAATVDACAQAGLPSAAIVELVTWLAMMQLLHRLTCWATPCSPTGTDT